MRTLVLASILAVGCVAATPAFAANHREAPITALDHKADITDVYAFRSYDGIGPTAIPRSRSSCASIRSSSRPTARTGSRSIPTSSTRSRSTTTTTRVEDIVFQFRFTTEQRLPNLFQVYAGAGGGISRAGQLAGAGAAGHADRSAADHRASAAPGSASGRATR